MLNLDCFRKPLHLEFMIQV